MSSILRDICRTAFAEDFSSEQVEYLRLFVHAGKEAASATREGVKCIGVYDTAYAVFEEKNLGKYSPDDIGYGVGLRQSECYPIIEKGSHTVLKENMVVALVQTTSFSKKVGG